MLLRPGNYNMDSSMHKDVNIRNLSEASYKQYSMNLHLLVRSLNKTQYHTCHLKMGISKPSIFSGITQSNILRLPKSAGSDIMHLRALNLSDLIISLWCGTINCMNSDDKDSWD